MTWTRPSESLLSWRNPTVPYILTFFSHFYLAFFWHSWSRILCLTPYLALYLAFYLAPYLNPIWPDIYSDTLSGILSDTLLAFYLTFFIHFSQHSWSGNHYLTCYLGVWRAPEPLAGSWYCWGPASPREPASTCYTSGFDLAWTSNSLGATSLRPTGMTKAIK